MAKRVDGIDHIASHPDEAAPAGDQARLALDGLRWLEAGTGQRDGKASRGRVLVDVTWLKLDDVYLSAFAHTVDVLRVQDGALPEVWPKVVDEHASFYVLERRGTSVEAQRFHVTMRIEMA